MINPSTSRGGKNCTVEASEPRSPSHPPFARLRRGIFSDPDEPEDAPSTSLLLDFFCSSSLPPPALAGIDPARLLADPDRLEKGAGDCEAFLLRTVVKGMRRRSMRRSKLFRSYIADCMLLYLDDVWMENSTVLTVLIRTKNKPPEYTKPKYCSCRRTNSCHHLLAEERKNPTFSEAAPTRATPLPQPGAYRQCRRTICHAALPASSLSSR